MAVLPAGTESVRPSRVVGEAFAEVMGATICFTALQSSTANGSGDLMRIFGILAVVIVLSAGVGAVERAPQRSAAAVPDHARLG